MVPKRLKIIFLILLFSAFPLLAKGQECEVIKFHTGKQYCFGTRASGMGGAYSSIADDASGIFYNPAGIARGGELQAYIEVGLKRHHLEYPDEGEFSLGEKNTFPHYVGISLPVKGVSVGIAHYVPYGFYYETEIEDHDAQGGVIGLFKFEEELTQEVTSAALAWRSGNEWLLGARLDYCDLKKKDRLPDETWRLEADDLAVALGLIYNHNLCNNWVSLGVVVGSGAKLEGTEEGTDEPQKAKCKYTIPFEFKIGLSCKLGSNITIAEDIVYWRKEAYSSGESSTTRLHLGGEYQVHIEGGYQFILPLRWGFYTKPLPYETTFLDFKEHILTLGTGLEFKNLLLGLSYEGGLGGDTREDLFKGSITYKH